MDKQNETELNFQVESGIRQSDRLVQQCLDGLAILLDGKCIGIGTDLYKLVIVGKDEKIMLDVRDLPGFDHIEFTIRKTGWGRGV